MHTISAFAETATLVGDPARAGMLLTLMGGRALTAGELARAAGAARDARRPNRARPCAERLAGCRDRHSASPPARGRSASPAAASAGPPPRPAPASPRPCCAPGAATGRCRSLAPPCFRRRISRMRRIDTLSAGIGPPARHSGRAERRRPPSGRALATPSGVADFRSEWPRSNRIQWPTSPGIRTDGERRTRPPSRCLSIRRKRQWRLPVRWRHPTRSHPAMVLADDVSAQARSEAAGRDEEQT